MNAAARISIPKDGIQPDANRRLVSPFIRMSDG